MSANNLISKVLNSLSYKEIIESSCIDSHCSCSQCNLGLCFELRKIKSISSCTCSECKQAKSCAKFTKEVTEKPYSANINETTTKKDLNQVEKELFHVITEAANSSIGNRDTTNLSKDISLIKNKPNPTNTNVEWIKNEINEIKKEFWNVISGETNSFTDQWENAPNIFKDASLSKNKPCSTTDNEYLIKDDINQVEKELFHGINEEASLLTDSRKYKSIIIKDTSQPQNEPHSTTVNEDLLKNDINQVEKQFCHGISEEANSSIYKSNNTTNISKNTSLTKNNLHYTKLNDELVKNETNELAKKCCHEKSEEANSYIDTINNTSNISKNISITKNKPQYTKLNEELVKNEFKQIEKEFGINGEANSFTDSRKYKTNTSKDTSQTKNKPHSTTVNEDMIKNEIKRLEREFFHIINEKAKTSADNRKHTKKCTNCNSITKEKSDSNNVNNECIKQCKRDICHVINKDANSSADNHEYTKYSSKDISLKKDKIAWNNQNKSFTKSSTNHHIHSVTINYKPKENNFHKEKYLPKEKISEENRLSKEHSLTKEHSLIKDNCLPEENDLTKENYSPEKSKLSAQIMNLPFNDFRDSLSVNNSLTNVPSPSFNKIIKSDFLTKLKEIYNACSCKVCECLSGKFLSTNDNICNCKPCECDECTKYARNFKHDLKYAPHSGCPCVSCDRKDCRGVVKNEQDEKKCDCRPCDCVKCWDFPSKPCNCKPCQCTECNALGASRLRTVIVAPVQGNFQQNMCQCEPCECINCTHNYTAMASNLSRRQVSTEIISHVICHCETCSNDACQLNSEVCRCDMHSKLMKKPNERASPDYDIHRAIINRQEGKGQFNSHDTIVTYALSNNDYSNLKSYSKSNCDDCKCINCECIMCEGKYKILNKCPKPYHESFNTCKCSPCECQICSKINKQKNAEVNHFRFHCGCYKCDCFDCKTLLNYANDSNNMIATNNSLCKMCCPAKKGKLLTPSMLDTHMSSVSKLTSCTSNQLKKETKDTSYFNVSANDYFCRKPSHETNVTVCHTESKHNNMASVYEENIIFDVSEYPSKIIASNSDTYQNDLKKNIEDIYEKEKSTILSKNSTYNNTHDKLCEIFDARKQKPIRDIELLEKYIYLPHMLPKTNAALKKSTINPENTSSQILSNEIAETCLIDRNLVPCIFQNTSKELVYTNHSSAVSTEDINLNETRNSKTFHTNSSKSIMLFDKNSSSIHIDSHDYENQFINMNKTNDNNDLKNNFEDTSDINPVDCLGATYNSSTFTAKSNEIVDLKNDMVNKDSEVEEKERYTAISMTKLSKHNVHKSSKKCKGRKYNKLYNKIMKGKVNESNIIQTNQTNIVPEENTIFESVKKGLLSINDNEVESLDYDVKNKCDLIIQSKVSSTASINKLFTSRNILCKNLNTEIQNNNINDNIAWPIMRKNLYLSCTEVAKSNGTIPAMEFDIKKTLKSISLQTSKCVNKIETSNGKQALNRLLIEVHNLLNLPLLQSHFDISPDIKQEPNYVSKSELDLELNTVHSNVTNSKCNYIDKETYCNLIRSMEMLQENITNLMENVLTNAVYKSELLTPKLNLDQGPLHNIPTINSAKSSCHSFKATFVGLRTISDHTVMVKWRLPPEVIYVQGYELQVDGRPVQKIFSPTRRMAILTCLPHSEKLLLTIRTLITSNLPFDHQPAATIVYRPRKRKCCLQ